MNTCSICSQLSYHVEANLKANESLPAVAAKLVDLQVSGESKGEIQYTYKKCPECGQYYRYEYYWDSGGGVGPSFESEALDKILDLPSVIKR